MKKPGIIVLLLLGIFSFRPTATAQTAATQVDFFGVKITLSGHYQPPPFKSALSDENIQKYLEQIQADSLQPHLDALLQYKKQYQPDDWLYYQLVRKMAQQISPKAENYYRYTFFKWWLLVHSGYDAKLTYSATYLLFYVQSNENIYNIPFRVMNDKQYVCLNYHDYGTIDFNQHHFQDVTPYSPLQAKAFTYKVTHLPEFNQTDYAEKEVQFTDGQNQYAFRIKLNQQVKALFTNYPVVDYDLQFNMPLSKITYESLIPSLKKQLQGMKQKEGVEFLLHFTRYAFLFKPDSEVFGSEKRLTPEQTLLYEYSDCEDRAALFFFLVKEIYNLPILVLTFPEHVTIAVHFDKPIGKTIEYNGLQYSVCEPSPQRSDLRIGQLLPELKKQSFQIAYAYQPQ